MRLNQQILNAFKSPDSKCPYVHQILHAFKLFAMISLTLSMCQVSVVCYISCVSNHGKICHPGTFEIFQNSQWVDSVNELLAHRSLHWLEHVRHWLNEKIHKSILLLTACLGNKTQGTCGNTLQRCLQVGTLDNGYQLILKW